MTTSPARKKLLIVDDSRANRYVMRRLLEKHPYELVEAASGQEGIARSREPGIDLVLLDVNMPDLSGFEVCREIRAHAPTARLPVLMTSSHFIQPEAEELGVARGADFYLVQPISPHFLLSLLQWVLRAVDAERELAILKGGAS